MHDMCLADDVDGDNGDTFGRTIEKGKSRKYVIEEMWEKEMLCSCAKRLCIKRYNWHSSRKSSEKEMSTIKISEHDTYEGTIKENKGAKIQKSITELIEFLKYCDYDEIINNTVNTLGGKLVFLFDVKLCRENIFD